MAQHIISAFIGRSFEKEDDPLWNKLSTFFNSLEDIGFKWEDAEKSQLKPISDKVKEKINRNDIFIGMLTKRNPVCHNIVSFGKYSFSETLDWLTSYWIIQESGYAIGRGKKVFFLKDPELQIPGGLNADHEYIDLHHNDLNTTFVKLNEIILSEIRKKIIPIETQMTTSGIDIITPPDKAPKEELRPSEEETMKFSDVQAAIKEKNYVLAEELFKDLLTTKFYEKEKIRKLAEAYYYKELYYSGEKTAIDKLRNRLTIDPDDYFSREGLFECYQLFDDDESTKSEIDNLLKRDISHNTKVDLWSEPQRLHKI